jgi:hypothetical protein
MFLIGCAVLSTFFDSEDGGRGTSFALLSAKDDLKYHVLSLCLTLWDPTPPTRGGREEGTAFLYSQCCWAGNNYCLRHLYKVLCQEKKYCLMRMQTDMLLFSVKMYRR